MATPLTPSEMNLHEIASEKRSKWLSQTKKRTVIKKDYEAQRTYAVDKTPSRPARGGGMLPLVIVVLVVLAGVAFWTTKSSASLTTGQIDNRPPGVMQAKQPSGAQAKQPPGAQPSAAVAHAADIGQCGMSSVIADREFQGAVLSAGVAESWEECCAQCVERMDCSSWTFSEAEFGCLMKGRSEQRRCCCNCHCTSPLASCN
jgi:hypothetical protein